jgi:hypothetical protein
VALAGTGRRRCSVASGRAREGGGEAGLCSGRQSKGKNVNAWEGREVGSGRGSRSRSSEWETTYQFFLVGSFILVVEIYRCRRSHMHVSFITHKRTL